MTNIDKANQALSKLNEKQITPQECRSIFAQLKMQMPKNIVEAIENISLKIEFNIGKPTINNLINARSYLETEAYIKKIINTGINIDDLKDELVKQWDEGKITGFNLRYITEILGVELPEEFIKYAMSIGRYIK